MSKPKAAIYFIYRKQRGAVVLMTVTLLLMLITLTTLYTGRSQTFEHQILINSVNHKMALMAAQAGLNRTLARLRVNKHLTNVKSTELFMDNSGYQADVNFKAVTTPFGVRTLVDIQASGFSADGLGAASITEQALIFPVLANIPVAPVMVLQGIAQSAEFKVVTNPDGLATATPLSIWSSKDVMIGSPTSSTCHLLDYNQGQCLNLGLSTSTQQSQDIQQHSTSFPSNLFGYLFNLPNDQVVKLQEWASVIAADCAGITTASRGLILVKGDCQLALGMQLGSSTEPVILFVEDGELVFESGVTMYGVVFSFRSFASSSVSLVHMKGNANLQGAFVTNQRLGMAADKLTVIYNRAVLEKLLQQKALLAVARVPGSWKDF